jgi:hypothetical protein
MEQMSNDDLRSLVVEKIRQTEELHTHIAYHQPGCSPDQYCAWIAQPTVWGGEIELRAMALLYNKLFCVVNVTENNNKTSVAILRYGEDLPSITQCIYLRYNGRDHYDLLYVTKKDNPKYVKTIFGREDSDVQNLLHNFIENKIKASSK